MVRYIDFCLAHGYSRFGKMSNSAGRQLTRWYQAQALFGIQAYCWHAEESQRDFLNSDNLGKTLVYECLSLMTLRVPRHESWRYHRCWKNILALFSGTVTFAEQIVSLFACHVESSYIQIIIYILLILLYHNILYMTRLCFIHIHQSHWDSSSSEPVASPDGWGIQIRLAMISLSQFWGLLETFGNKAIFVLGESSLRIACRLQIKLLEPAKTQTWFVRADLGCIDRRSHPSQLLTQTDANLQKL